MELFKENSLIKNYWLLLSAFTVWIQIAAMRMTNTYLTEFSIHREWNIRKFQRLSAKKRYIRIASAYDNFKKSMTAITGIDTHGIK